MQFKCKKQGKQPWLQRSLTAPFAHQLQIKIGVGGVHIGNHKQQSDAAGEKAQQIQRDKAHIQIKASRLASLHDFTAEAQALNRRKIRKVQHHKVALRVHQADDDGCHKPEAEGDGDGNQHVKGVDHHPQSQQEKQRNEGRQHQKELVKLDQDGLIRVMGKTVEHIADPDVSPAGNIQIHIGLSGDEDTGKKLQQTFDDKADNQPGHGPRIQRKRDHTGDREHDDLHNEDRGNDRSIFSKKLPLCSGLQLSRGCMSFHIVFSPFGIRHY